MKLPLLPLGFLLGYLAAPVSAQDLGQELLNQVRQCVMDTITNPAITTPDPTEIGMSCYMNKVVLGADGLPRADVQVRVTAFIKASGVKLPQRTGQSQVKLTGLSQLEGVFILPVVLGGQPQQLLLDTGASNTVLQSAVAEGLGLQGIQLPTSLLQQGVVGNECAQLGVTAAVYALPPMTLGQAQVTGLMGLGISRTFFTGAAVGALGLDFLSAYDLLLDPKRRQLQLQSPTPRPKTAIPLLGKHGLLAARVKINGQGPILLGLDTGASVMVVSQRLAQRLGLTSGKSEPIQGWCGSQAAQSTQLNRLQMGNFTAEKLMAYILPNALFDLIGVEGLVGQNFLNRFRQHWRFNGLNELGMVQSGSLVLSQP
ncbi:retropepsin-like aspartic protease [Candidatus Cyanaurora vandensis]|uniref:retropepsin-like aspartic protease n=1 Tax=Candidatus Cyanaurora vandensis TaxID=2714958 RepID=UPI00257A40A4|nr:retropepsin-like aspartic protease [Candidatus Cyanaurora vandensis]